MVGLVWKHNMNNKLNIYTFRPDLLTNFYNIGIFFPRAQLFLVPSWSLFCFWNKDIFTYLILISLKWKMVQLLNKILKFVSNLAKFQDTFILLKNINYLIKNFKIQKVSFNETFFTESHWILMFFFFSWFRFYGKFLKLDFTYRCIYWYVAWWATCCTN